VVPPPPPLSLKPARLSAAEARSLPRWSLVLLCLLYILPGLLVRDPWKNIDADHFGVMWTMAHGTISDWLLPNIAGAPMPRSGPLAFWAGASFIALFGNLIGDVYAARLATFFFFTLSAYSVWRTTFLLGRRQEAQPLRLAFGGQPEATDYGRVLADGALLIYLGSLGLIMFSHETSAHALYVALIAFTLCGCARHIDSPSAKHAALIGLALGCLVLTNGWIAPLVLCAGLGIAGFFCSVSRSRHLLHVLLALLVICLIVSIWPTLVLWHNPYAGSPVTAWMQWNSSLVALPDINTLKNFFHFVRYALWGFWPAWPFACWAVYTWHRQWRDPHIALPLFFVAVFLLLALPGFQREDDILLSMFPPLVILAAFGLPTMKRSAINAVDWFSVMGFTAAGIVIWTCWLAAQTGWPPRIARNALKLAPGFVPEMSLMAILVAACATLCWFLLVYWRISRRPPVLWRAVVLSSGGVILCWLLLATLWLPWINYNKSYAGVARQMSRHIPDKRVCVDAKVGVSQRASFAYFGQIRFGGLSGEKCGYVLLQDTIPRRNPPASPPLYKGMSLVWEGRRPSDRDERFRLYKRNR
jgi:4-amino-4-deoxy-L-arabinose transferase-like glycosyltransferase